MNGHSITFRAEHDYLRNFQSGEVGHPFAYTGLELHPGYQGLNISYVMEIVVDKAKTFGNTYV